MKENEIRTVKLNFNLKKSNNNEENLLEKKYIKIIKIINEKIKFNNEWTTSLNSYFLYEFFGKENLIATLNFKINIKSYICQFINIENFDNFKNFYNYVLNKTNYYNNFYSDDLKLFKIVIDSLNLKEIEKQLKNEQNITEIENILEENKTDFRIKNFNVSSFYANLFKSFEDYLIRKKMQNENLKQKELDVYTKANPQLFSINFDDYFIIMAYSPTNEHYYNPKLPDYYKAPNISVFIYSKKNITKNLNIYFFEKNYYLINNYFRNVIEYMYLSEMNQNIINAMGEASLIAQYWITTSINKILNNYDKELQLARDSKLLAKLIVKHILTEKIEGVENIEIYPFDRVFYINKPLFSNIGDETDNSNMEIIAYEALIETKIFDEKIPAKKFLNNSKFYVYEWERNAYNIGLEKLNLSKKEYRKIIIDDLPKKIPSDLEFRYKDDKESIMHNLVNNLFKQNKETKDNELILNYKKNYLNNGITYIYTSGVDLKNELETIYKIQEYYIDSIMKKNEDFYELLGLLENDRINQEEFEKGIKDILKDDYSQNAKVVIFSYTPEEKELQNKGFTLIIITNKDIQKSQMEIKSEKDDLLTVLKLLMNQHFVIDKKYKQRMDKNFKEITSALSEVNHKINNLLSQKDVNIEKLKEQINSFINTYIIKFKESNIFAEEKEFETSEKFFERMFITKINIYEALNEILEKNNIKYKDKIIKKLKEKSIDNVDEKFEKILNEILDEFKIENEYKKELIEAVKEKIQEKINIYFSTENETPWKQLAEKIYNEKSISDKEFTIICCKYYDIPYKIDVKLNITQTPPFKILWKDSFFNEFIYVMLKNAFEATLDYLKDKNDENNSTIEINLFITTINENNFINIEIINKMKGITKTIFENINSKIPKKETNPLKKASNGIGVQNIKTKIDSIYGLDKADLKFIITNKHTMVSVLTLPILIKQTNDLFVPESEANFLYVEDSATEYEKLNELFKKKGVIPKHFTYYNKNNYSLQENIRKFNVLITDANIPQSSNVDDTPAVRNSEKLIKSFIENKEKYLVIILSSDLPKINNVDIKEISNITEIKENENGIYHKKNKNLDDFNEDEINYLIELIKKFGINSKTQKVNINSQGETNMKTELQYKELKKFDDLLQKNKLILNKEDVNNILFYSEKKSDIKEWNKFKIKLDENDDIEITNPEIFIDDIYTKLIIVCDEKINIPIFHESLKNNILLIEKNIFKDNLEDKKMKQIIYKLNQIHFPLNGIFSRINHDILNKTTILSKDTVNGLREKNQYLRREFPIIYEKFLNNEKIEENDTQKLEEIYKKFIENLKNKEIDLKKDINIDNRHLGQLLNLIDNFNELYKKVKNEGI
jgi:hypothetical protein